MATQTPNLNLVLPDYADKADIGVVNDNFKKIDNFSGGGKVEEWLDSIQKKADESLAKINQDATSYLNNIQKEANESLNEIENKAKNSLESIPDDYEVLAGDVSQLKDQKVNKPTDNPNGEAGQTLRTNGDGTTAWATLGLPTDAQTETAVKAWLDAHPEATTTVQDGSLTVNKLVAGTLGFVTPEMFGAKGDGVTDDTDALEAMLAKKLPCLLSGEYLYSRTLNCYSDVIGGTLRHGADSIRLMVYGNGVFIKGVTFDVNNHTFNAVRADGANDVTIESCIIKNVGNDSAGATCGAIMGQNVKNFTVRGCSIDYCHTDNAHSTYGINVEGDSSHIVIDGNSIKDIMPVQDADGVKIMANGKAYAYIKNNTIENARKRCLKMKSEECHSSGNTFVYKNLPNFGQAVIEFQRSNCSSVDDRLVVVFDDETAVADFSNIFGVNGDNIVIDGFTSEFIAPDAVIASAKASGNFIKVYSNGDEGAPTSANNLHVYNVTCEELCRGLINIAEDGLTTVNNVKIKNVQFSKNANTSVYGLIVVPTTTPTVDLIEIDGLHYTGEQNADLTILSNTELADVRLNFKNIKGVMPYRYYFGSKNSFEAEYMGVGVGRFIAYRQNRAQVEIECGETIGNPSGHTGSTYRLARNTPLGAKLLLPEPTYDEAVGKVLIGYICTVAGTTKALGTFVSLYAST